MIYPATYDITILQNATWSGVFRVTENRKTLSSINIASGTPTFICSCHGFSAGDKVVFTGGTTVPCGLAINSVYYVISDGLTSDAFQVSVSDGGSSVTVSGDAIGTFYVAQPINLGGYVVDADVKGLTDNVQVATFTSSLTDSDNGEFRLDMAPAVAAGLDAGRYGWDISLTSSGGARYYWLTGVATVQRTYSRN